MADRVTIIGAALTLAVVFGYRGVSSSVLLTTQAADVFHWVDICCGVLGVVVALWVYLPRRAAEFPQNPASAVLLGLALALTGGTLGHETARLYLPPLGLLLTGARGQTVVAVQAHSYGGWGSWRSGCSFPLPVAEKDSHFGGRVCVSSSEFVSAIRAEKTTDVTLVLEGRQTNWGTFYWYAQFLPG